MSYTRPPRRRVSLRCPWTVTHHHGTFVGTVPAKFSTRGGAEEHAAILRRLHPDQHFEVTFQPYETY